MATAAALAFECCQRTWDVFGFVDPDGVKARVVSMPSWFLFEHQDQAYRDSVLPPAVRARVAVEQGGSMGWDRYVGHDGRTVTMSTFGASAPLAKLQDKFGFTVDNVVKVARECIAANKA